METSRQLATYHCCHHTHPCRVHTPTAVLSPHLLLPSFYAYQYQQPSACCLPLPFFHSAPLSFSVCLYSSWNDFHLPIQSMNSLFETFLVSYFQCCLSQIGDESRWLRENYERHAAFLAFFPSLG